MRVMISQPADRTGEEQARARARVIAELEAQGHEVWGEAPRWGFAPVGVNQELWWLGCRLQQMAGMDAVYFMDGWERDLACRMEYEAAAFWELKTINAEWRELKSAFSVNQTLYECFPDEMKFGESIEEVANRMIRYCRELCNQNRAFAEKCHYSLLAEFIGKIAASIYHEKSIKEFGIGSNSISFIDNAEVHIYVNKEYAPCNKKDSVATIMLKVGTIC